MIEKITDENFEEVIKTNEKVVVKFYADWCGVCKAFSPQFDKMANESSGQIKFVEINAPDNTKARLAAGVYSLPFFASYENGELKDKLSSSDRGKVQGLIDALSRKNIMNKKSA